MVVLVLQNSTEQEQVLVAEVEPEMVEVKVLAHLWVKEHLELP